MEPGSSQRYANTPFYLHMQVPSDQNSSSASSITTSVFSPPTLSSLSPLFIRREKMCLQAGVASTSNMPNGGLCVGVRAPTNANTGMTNNSMIGFSTSKSTNNPNNSLLFGSPPFSLSQRGSKGFLGFNGLYGVLID
ncbi:hypothetical protein Tcan_17711 [Toxocara canis]|uniref:Uncharacterized protein n=1 Tax=Toxocara canis TaxID=6265 RepID=A0A0B2W299_TOXCA|nr:hypothetical protein Tcan_17711 [Toxocara canis]